MSAIDDAVHALAESFQLDPMPAFDGHIVFTIGGMGRFDLEEHGEKLLVSLARDVSTSEDRLAIQRTALQLVHYDRQRQPPVQASMLKDTLVFSTQLSADEADVPAIDHALQTLHALHEEARG